MPRDQFGRQINYLRISLTDHCNLRCLYCMPLRDLQFAPSEELLSADEIEMVARAAAAVGFYKIRLTGGEPLLRPDVVEIVGRIAKIDGITDVGMTTNAILLPPMVEQLVAAGLQRINIHIDTLNPARLKRLMRFGTYERIWAGIESAERAGLHPIKINVVVTRDHNDADVVDLARLTLERDWHVRFIELMPLGGGECAAFSLAQYVPTSETRDRIEKDLGELTPLPASHPSDEARNYRLPAARGVVGFISPVSEPYCGSCNRMRLTADGRFHLCLLNDDEMDVKKALRNGGGVDTVKQILLRAVAHKPTGHRLEEGVSTEIRGMFQIGG
ncbi:MAG: GTP 3',8-cyclase MoaA [Planctomycetes bacterium]|nr:GTP 3',8-cyclase MoaA [Planctomycetota bacterium]